MELKARQKNLMRAAARKIRAGEFGRPEDTDNGVQFYEAIKPIIRDAILEAAPEIPKREVAEEITPVLIYTAAYYLHTLAAGKKIGKARKAAAFMIGALLLFAGAGRISAQCPGGNCQLNNGGGNTANTGYTYNQAGWGWFWPGWGYNYYQQPQQPNTPAPEPEKKKETPKPVKTKKPAAEEAPKIDEIPEWEPVEPPAAEEPEPAPAPEPESKEPFICPLAKAAVEAVNSARTGCGLPALKVDTDLCTACALHSAAMKINGFGHAADGGRECIAENYPTPAATVAAWLASPPHAKILFGEGTRIGIGVVGKFYTLRIR